MAQGRIRRLVTRGRVEQVLTCFVLGGIVTIVVAWGCALIVPSKMQADVTERGWFYEEYLPDGWPHLDTMWIFDGVGFTHKSAFREVARDEVLPTAVAIPGQVFVAVYRISENQFGLVWRSMSTFDALVSGDPQLLAQLGPSVYRQPEFSLSESGIGYPTWLPVRSPGQKLPLRPLLPGFLYSTLLYGVFAWLLLFAPGPLRRHIRHRRGLCLGCGYPLGDFAVCPECGKPTGREA